MGRRGQRIDPKRPAGQARVRGGPRVAAGIGIVAGFGLRRSVDWIDWAQGISMGWPVGCPGAGRPPIWELTDPVAELRGGDALSQHLHEGEDARPREGVGVDQLRKGLCNVRTNRNARSAPTAGSV